MGRGTSGGGYGDTRGGTREMRSREGAADRARARFDSTRTSVARPTCVIHAPVTGRTVRQTRGLTHWVAPNLVLDIFLREGRRMLFIAAGLFLVLVTADLLDLSARKRSGSDRLGRGHGGLPHRDRLGG